MGTVKEGKECIVMFFQIPLGLFCDRRSVWAKLRERDEGLGDAALIYSECERSGTDIANERGCNGCSISEGLSSFPDIPLLGLLTACCCVSVIT